MESFLNRAYGFDASKTENRMHLRFPLSLRAECHYKAGEYSQECRIVDICQQGLGFELDSQVGIRYGQNVLLTIFPPDKKIPVNAIVKLQWAKIPSEGPLKQRVGSRLIFMDPKEKAHLLLQAYAIKLAGMSKNNFALRSMSLRYPRFQ